MYGQTNLFVSPSIIYGVFKASERTFYIATGRAARNMAFQGIFPEWGTAPKVMEIKGSNLIGTLVRAPLSAKDTVYMLPTDTIKETKGTGLVTSVPSDSPDDCAMTKELSKKGALLPHRPRLGMPGHPPHHRHPRVRQRRLPFLCQNGKLNLQTVRLFCAVPTIVLPC